MRLWTPDEHPDTHPEKHRIAALAACLIAICALLPLAAQEPNFESSPSQSTAKHPDFVTFVAAEPVIVTATKPAIIPLRFRVADGMHVNSHAPHTKELIPTQLAVEEIPGLNVTSVDFPAGVDYSFAFMPREKLSVYAGEFVLQAHIIARQGDHPVHGLLRYQACDSRSCYPPRTIPVSFEVVAK